MYQNQTFSKNTSAGTMPQNFLHAELDPLNSTFKMLMYREGFAHPNTYYSKKKDFPEPEDKEYLMLSMIERFIGRNNCFFRQADFVNGKTYSPATMIEFWRVFQDENQERLVLRMFHPTKNTLPYKVFDYLNHHHILQQRLNKYYELMRVGKMDCIGGSKPRRLELDETKDFYWYEVSEAQFNQHLAHLYAKYPSKGRIDIYRDAYYQRYFASPKKGSSMVHRAKVEPENTAIPSQLTPALVSGRVNNPSEYKRVWAKCLEIIAGKVDAAALQTWFLSIIPVSLEQNRLTIQVPSLFVYEWIEENYVSHIRLALDSTLGINGELVYTIHQ